MIDSRLYNEKNLWTHLAKTDLPITVYGMGNGADKIIVELSKRNIDVADFFA